jgi:hypothetical protein
MPLISYVANRIWLCAYPVRLAGTSFEARMTVIRLASGQIIVHSPCSITAALAEDSRHWVRWRTLSCRAISITCMRPRHRQHFQARRRGFVLVSKERGAAQASKALKFQSYGDGATDQSPA